ncbi:sulfatase-like hydrolase/transferase [Luteolibacter marinus]|uniref:sulfatase-like hydrolase/transferase n=1 Tax=Luteolibacter marinus TaxID=2776705 RepID=UPI00186677B7|nr:sulfatase-like hydrolase/transferase [Luteolibacter marinus]
MFSHTPTRVLSAAIGLGLGLSLSPAFAEIIVRSNGNTGGVSEVGILAELDGSGNGFSATGIWDVSGSVTEPGAFNGSVRLKFDAMKNVSTDPATLGDELVDGNVDRDANGYIGVEGNPNGGGIGADVTNREGIAIRFDEINGVTAGVGVQLTRINVRNVGRSGTDPVGTESFTVVNLLTRESMTVVPTAGSEGDFDVTSLNLVRTSGDPGPVAAIFSGDTGGFRIDGVNFTVQPGEGDLPPLIGAFVANDSSISAGDDLRLSWDVLGADSITISPAPGEVGGGTSGFAIVNPATITTYSLTATNEHGSSTSELTVRVDGSPATPAGPVGEDGIRYVSGEVVILDPPPASVRAGDSERHAAIQLIPEKGGVTLAAPVEVDHLVGGPVSLSGNAGTAGTLPTGVPLNSFLLHADLPDDAPQVILTTTITFDAPIVGLAYRTETAPASGFANRLEETDAAFGLDGMLFESESLSPDSALRRSVDGEVADEISISPDGMTLTATFRLLGSSPKVIDDLRVITRATPVAAPAGAPNIVFFLADDMGIGDTSAYQDWSGLADGDQIVTPAMERLADLGMRFTDAHAQNRCTPTRYALMTGRYAWRAGLLNGVLMGAVKPPMIEKERPTLPAFLKAKGYATAMVGKWHLGLEYRQDDGLPAAGWDQADFGVMMRDTPLDHGFDFFHGFSRSHLTSGPDGQDGNGPAQDIGPGWLEGRRVAGVTGRGKQLDGSYDWDGMGQEMLDQARGFMQSHLGNTSESQRPFFLYFASHSNHQVYTPDTAIDGVPVVGESHWKDGSPTGDVRRDFVYLNDVLLGRLMDYLETTDDPRNPGAKLIDNTLLVFGSDNGSEINEQRAVGNLRAFKARIYEGGHRVPMMAYWKNGGIGDGTEGNGGITRDDLVAMQDIFPTVAELLGSPLDDPAAAGDAAVDGFPRGKVFKNQPADPRPPILTNEQAGNTWLALQYHGTIPLDPPLTGYWKIIFDNPLLNNANAGTGNAIPLELYNLETDRLEANDLIGNPAYAGLIDWLSAWAERIANGDLSREAPPLPESSLFRDNGGLRMDIPARPFFFYEVWGSENLDDWSRVATLQSPAAATLDYPLPIDRPRRFFQVRVRQ